MKTLVLGVGAFGIATLHHLAKNHPEQIFYGYEKDEVIFEYLTLNRKHPFFFTDIAFLTNIEIIPDIISILPSIELLIIAIPNQFIRSSLVSLAPYLKSGIIILNLSKGIDNTTLKTVSETIEDVLGEFPYYYAVLSGGMIASDFIEGKKLGAQIGISDSIIEEPLRELFQSDELSITLSKNYKNIELLGALKNIFALYVGYLEGKGMGFSTIGYHFCELYKDMTILIQKFGGSDNMDFSDYALGGDLIATSFGNSRNRYFGKLVGEGESPLGAYEILRSEKKHAEGYATIQGIAIYIGKGEDFLELRKVIQIFL